jgi:hypothetical protein
MLVQGAIARKFTRAVPAERPMPGGGPGTLAITDSRTGKTYEVCQVFWLGMYGVLLVPSHRWTHDRDKGSVCSR